MLKILVLLVTFLFFYRKNVKSHSFFWFSSFFLDFGLLIILQTEPNRKQIETETVLVFASFPLSILEPIQETN